jgi:hypothetical protein
MKWRRELSKNLNTKSATHQIYNNCHDKSTQVDNQTFIGKKTSCPNAIKKVMNAA